MNVIALNGSARGKKGVTWRLLDSLLKGLSEGGLPQEISSSRK
jgi:hypothetical protein